VLSLCTATALRREDVHVDRGTMGELSVDLSVYGWFPDMLPSEAAEAGSDSDDHEQAAHPESS